MTAHEMEHALDTVRRAANERWRDSTNQHMARLWDRVAGACSEALGTLTVARAVEEAVSEARQESEAMS